MIMNRRKLPQHNGEHLKPHSKNSKYSRVFEKKPAIDLGSMHWYLAIFLPVIVTPSSPKKCTISLFLKKPQRCKQMCFLLLVVAFRSTSHVTMFWFRVVRPSKNSTENSENLEWKWLSFFWGTPILGFFQMLVGLGGPVPWFWPKRNLPNV